MKLIEVYSMKWPHQVEKQLCASVCVFEPGALGLPGN